MTEPRFVLSLLQLILLVTSGAVLMFLALIGVAAIQKRRDYR